MIDLGPQVLAACRAVDLPCYRGGWRAGAAGQTPPDVYAVFNAFDQNGVYADDARQSTRHYVYLNVYAQKQNPRTAGKNITDQMEQRGFVLVDGRDQFAQETGSSVYAMTYYTEVYRGD